MCQHAVCVYTDSTICVSMQCVCTDGTVKHVSAYSVCVQTVQYGMCQHAVCMYREYSMCQHAVCVCVYRQYSRVCVSMNCVCVQTVQ